MPTAFEREAARQAALAVNAARFTGRPTPTTVPPPAPVERRINIAELEAMWNTGGAFRFPNPIRWGADAEFVQFAPPPIDPAPPPPQNKTVTFEGMELEVPHWAMFVTQNKDGKIIAFGSRPFYREDLGYYAIGTFPIHKVIMKPEEYPERIENV
jgi:hypothetical protein